MLRHLTRALVATGLLLTMACGGDDDGGDGGGDALTKEEVIERGDEICREADEELEAVEGLDTDPFAEDNEEFLAAIDEGIEITEDRLEAFRDLDPPEEDQETIDRLIELQEESLERVREFRTAIEEGDEEAANELINANSAAANEAEQIASEYGFEECASLA